MPNDLLVLLPHARRLHARGLFRGDVLICARSAEGIAFLASFYLWFFLWRKDPAADRPDKPYVKGNAGSLWHTPVLTLAVLQAEADTLTLKLPFYLPYTEIIRS